MLNLVNALMWIVVCLLCESWLWNLLFP